jgi:crotonobetainyl-CoA:carnitine CoA-transferase CaiB-like acyl-CoA transferase
MTGFSPKNLEYPLHQIGSAKGVRVRPLAGVRVLDASGYISGPFATLNLADLGADVQKVEPPRGEALRRFGVRHNGIGLSFAAINANKTSVSLNLKDPADLETFRHKLSESDILLTNWRPSVAAGLGLNPDEIRRDYPRLIWVRISGYGQDGPFADRPAFDAILQARSGIALAREGEATMAAGYIADKTTAMFSVQSALAALLQRERTGSGAVIDISMLDAMAYFNIPDLFAGSVFLGERDHEVMQHVGATRPLATKDGWIVLSPVSGAQLQSLGVAVGRPEWGNQLQSAAGPAALIKTMNELLETVLPERTTAEWEVAFADADVPASGVLTFEEHLADPQVAHNQLYHDIDGSPFGPQRRIRYPALFDGRAVETDDLSPPVLQKR